MLSEVRKEEIKQGFPQVPPTELNNIEVTRFKIIVQLWWLGGRASASHSVEVCIQTLIKCYLGGSNPAWVSLRSGNTLSQFKLQGAGENNAYFIESFKCY